MTEDRKRLILNAILEEIDLPESAYDRAKIRYEDIGQWLHRPDSACCSYAPHVYPQGSFRLGLANKPLRDGKYDLDISCCLEDGLTKARITQEQLKDLVANDLRDYRKARGITEDIAYKRRCLRLEYRDDLSFHMDIVPSIPEAEDSRTILKERMIANSHMDSQLAASVAEDAVAITDDQDPSFDAISRDWRISNPEGFAKWFESRMRTAQTFLTEREIKINASIDTLPTYQWKTPLQQAIQLLKRHRDVMYEENEDSKPISVIITTLSARAYRGENTLPEALETILAGMEYQLQEEAPIVPNPVNPKEDFADKWYDEEYKDDHLEMNFRRWLMQAKADFSAILNNNSSEKVADTTSKGLGVHSIKSKIEKVVGTAATAAPTIVTGKASPRPWLQLDD